MTTGERMKLRRKAISMSAEEVAAELGLSAATIYRYEKGDIEKIPGKILEPLSEVLATTPAYLMGWTDDPENYERAEELDYLSDGWMEHFNGDVEAAVKAYRALDKDRAHEFALPEKAIRITQQRVPMLGNIHAGEPTYAEQEFDCYVEAGAGIKCDFALRVVGDSMINARICDGDIVFIRKQDRVEEGEIAAVLINDDTTLKRVRYLPGGLVMLMPENPKYAPIIVGGENETRNVRILGKAVAFQSDVR